MIGDTKPDWAAKAEKNTTGKQLGEMSHAVASSETVKSTVTKTVPKKVGRKKSRIERKKVMFALSEYQIDQLEITHGLIKAGGVKLTRGRSEATELASALLKVMLNSEEHRAFALSVIKDYHEYEEKNLDENI